MRNNGGEAFVKCMCVCGLEKLVCVNGLRRGKTTRCFKCSRVFDEAPIEHAYRIKQALYNAINRCKNDPNYYERGIQVYAPWLDDHNLFFRHLMSLEGWDDDTLTLDRINNNGDYEPGNLRFTTREVQNKNTRRQRKSRPEWDQSFLEICNAISLRSKDPSTQIGACVVDEHKALLSTGYNGPPRTCDDSVVPWTELDENGRKLKYPWIIHAEENAVLFAIAALGSYVLTGCVLYTSGYVCSRCLRLAAHVGVQRVVCGPTQPACCDPADRELSARIAAACGVSVETMD